MIDNVFYDGEEIIVIIEGQILSNFYIYCYIRLCCFIYLKINIYQRLDF